MAKLVKTGPEVEQWCKDHNWQKTLLADALGVTRQTLHNWITSDQAVPRVLTLSLFALEHLPDERLPGTTHRKASKRRAGQHNHPTPPRPRNPHDHID